MHCSYIVAYCLSTKTDRFGQSIVTSDCYQVCDSFQEAEEVYYRIVSRDDCHSASLTQTLKSTDYDTDTGFHEWIKTCPVVAEAVDTENHTNNSYEEVWHFTLEVDCQDCDGEGYHIDVVNTKTNELEIQKCDTCNEFSSDANARDWHYNVSKEPKEVNSEYSNRK